jgi:histidinol dehydrogenase
MNRDRYSLWRRSLRVTRVGPRDNIRIIDIKVKDTAAAVSNLRSLELIPLKVTRTVQRILKDVKTRGDQALLEYTKLLDGAELTFKNMKVSSGEIKNAYRIVSHEQISALQFAQNRIKQFELRVMDGLYPPTLNGAGIRITQKIVPIKSAGCYVPGGRASYPSSLLMTVTPAKIAGVSRIAVASPPNEDGLISPLLLVAADICGVDEFYKIGGAQAIAALTYGTDTVKSVEKIVGPGNVYVTAAKQAVTGVVGIDLPAGPSEVLVLADASTNPYLVAKDVISQSEHGPDSVCGVATDSVILAQKVVDILKRTIDQVPRRDMVKSSLRKNGFIALCQNIDQMVEFTNLFAPEHLEIMTAAPAEVAKRITTAGLILLGPYSPVAVSDYCVGTNHVLPTGGWARRSSGLSCLDFVRRMDIVECSKQGLYDIRKIASLLASSEGLQNHKSALDARFRVEHT